MRKCLGYGQSLLATRSCLTGRSPPALLVPPTSIATTTERTFVIRIKNDVAEWVSVSHGAAAGDLVEVYGLKSKATDWDTIPSPSQNYDAAREEIKGRVRDLVDDLSKEGTKAKAQRPED
jgi:hypothetical protein